VCNWLSLLGLNTWISQIGHNVKRTFALRLALVCILLPAVSAFACGDKLLRMNRLYRKHVPANATVLLYQRPDSLLGNAPTSSLQHAFKDEGYHLLVVTNERDLTLALEAGAADVVIADVSDVALIQQLGRTKPPLVIPYVPKGDLANGSTPRQYAAVIQSPSKPGKFIDAVDRAYESKPSSGAKLKPVSTGN